jgi:probable addiction module antidote protein/putative addiction module killer protein
VLTLIRSKRFDAWLRDLTDRRGKARIFVRLDRARLGNFGDWVPVGEGVSEMRIDVGPGYRVYFVRQGSDDGAQFEGGAGPMTAADYLDDEETIAEYLTAAAEDGNTDALLLALANVAKARGMAQVARDAGLGRESLYKALAPGSHPRFETIAAVTRALGFRLKMGGSMTPDAKTPKLTRSTSKGLKGSAKKTAVPTAAAKGKVRRAARKGQAKSTAKRRA